MPVADKECVILTRTWALEQLGATKLVVVVEDGGRCMMVVKSKEFCSEIRRQKRLSLVSVHHGKVEVRVNLKQSPLHHDECHLPLSQ